jgi:hypothetical protein
MPPANPTDALNRLLQLVYRSLPVYLEGVRPWVAPGEQGALELLRRMAADHRRYAERLVAAIRQCGARPEFGSFPAFFTSVHDLSLDYLLRRVRESQRQAVEEIDRCAVALAGQSRWHWLAEEILGNTQGYLEMLEESGIRDPSRHLGTD